MIRQLFLAAWICCRLISMKRSFISFFNSTSFVVFFAICLTFNVEAAGLVAKPAKQDVPRSKTPARFAGETAEVLITLNGKAMSGKNTLSAAEYAAINGMPLLRPLRANKQMAVLKFSNISEAQKAIALMRKDNKILSATFNRILPHVPHAFVSNDPYFPQQWHLNDGLDATPGVSVAGPWSNDITGLGVVIGIVDAGLDKDHEDLAAHFDDANSYDFAGNDSDPSPEGEQDSESHGTSVAGVAAGADGLKLEVHNALEFA